MSLDPPADRGNGPTEPRREPKIEFPALHGEDDSEILRAIVEGTARSTGEEFFQSLVRHLAAAIGVRYAFVAEFAGSETRVRSLALWNGASFAENIEWDLDGTPCQEVVLGRLCHHPRDVHKIFPKDVMLAQLGIESYLGVPLLDASGTTIGHLAVLDDQPMPTEIKRVFVFRIFAARAAAELERVHMERRIQESERRYRDLFDEAPIGYVFEDTETRFQSANRAAQQILGITAQEVKGTVGLTLVANTPESQEQLHRSLAAEQSGKELPYIEIELRRKNDGKSVWIQRWSRPEPDGKYTRTMIIDVTARVLAERERNRLKAQNQYLQEEIQHEYNFEEIVGSSSALNAVIEGVKQVAPTNSTVLLLGETGTGKELIARAIHNSSRRKDRPLIKLNCAALPTGLIESELFGHEKGAFTGALERRVGRFVLADGGTILLDEIGDVPPEVQLRLLRVLQEQEFEPVGSARTIKVDVRVIAATNRNLEKAVEDGTFRADLYYRLNVFPISLPPLRDRGRDVELLAHYFTQKYALKIGKSIDSISTETLELLHRYPWPGNIRELENIIERAVILCRGATLEIDPALLRIPAASMSGGSVGSAATAPKAGPIDSTAASSAENERQHLLRALERANWVIEGGRGAASALGLHPNTLRSRMKKLGLQRPTTPS